MATIREFREKKNLLQSDLASQAGLGIDTITGKLLSLLKRRKIIVHVCQPRLTTNVELNIQLRREVELLQDWYERHWKEAEDISGKIFKVIERRAREYSPFEIYAKSLREFFPN